MSSAVKIIHPSNEYILFDNNKNHHN
uniref:Uncharacterized protein n=1 Tax=Anguilla anguilla TaxID=7936 RepID=A0A0E9UNC4_ANGAN